MPSGSRIRFLSTAAREHKARFSPDGRWVAYESNATGRDEIFVRPFPGPGGQWQASVGGGISPRWGADGKELYTGEFIMTKKNMDDPEIRGKFDPDYQAKRTLPTPKYKKK